MLLALYGLYLAVRCRLPTIDNASRHLLNTCFFYVHSSHSYLRQGQAYVLLDTATPSHSLVITTLTSLIVPHGLAAARTAAGILTCSTYNAFEHTFYSMHT